MINAVNQKQKIFSRLSKIVIDTDENLVYNIPHGDLRRKVNIQEEVS